jgi:hypothetical protein
MNGICHSVWIPCDRLMKFLFFQYYLANREHYVTGGPVFIYVGSDGYEVYDQYIRTGLVYDIASELGGYMFALEPRFYGKSRPTKYKNNIILCTLAEN